MELDLLIIISCLAIVMVGIHIFFNPIRKRGKEGTEEKSPDTLYRKPYSTRRKRYKDRV